MLNSSHCSSSQEFDETSKDLRMIALTVATIDRHQDQPCQALAHPLVNASIPRLNFKSDCNESPSQLRLCRLDRARQAQRLIQPG